MATQDCTDAKSCLQLFNAFQATRSDLVFMMSRSCDAKLVGYMARREGNELARGREVGCIAVVCPDFRKETDLHPLVVEKFLAMTVRPQPGTKKYVAWLAALPDRSMTLSLKRNSAEGASDGRVVASGTLVLPGGHPVHDVQMFCIEQNMSFDALGIPDLKHIVLMGCVPAHTVPAALHKHCVSVPEAAQLIVCETVPVTAELRARFPLEALARELILGRGGSSTAAPK